MNPNDVFDLCVYIATSARGLKDEPKDYGPIRLLEVLSRLADHACAETDDPFLKEVAAEAATKLRLVMTDRDAFYAYLEQLVVSLVREVKRRRCIRGPAPACPDAAN
jgi:hypothetical protein